MMQPWFTHAKLGIFLHWGIYAVKGIPESWSFFNGQISYEDYMAQAKAFTASKYDPKAWADLFKRAGAKYAVLTSKHHDGFALWDTKLSNLSAPKASPAGRDLIGPYCSALREAGLKVGLYFSHLDWSHPDYASVFPAHMKPAPGQNRFAYPQGAPDPARWERFLQFHRGQIKELCESFHPDLLWFDGDWERDDAQWRMAELREQIHAWSGPEVILNSRMRGHGDYETPEQGMPVTPPQGPWEFCMTINDSWGFQPHDQNYKSVRQLVRYLVECISMGGNLLLDITPKEDGTFPPEQVQRLEALGAWIARHEEAIYPTVAGLPPTNFYGPTTLGATTETIYAFLFDRPVDQIAVKGIRNNIKRVSVVGSGRELTQRKLGGASWSNIPGVLWIDVPGDVLDPLCTVLKIDLEGPLDLYTGRSGAVQSN
jgi:alpha-L-fucosidase